MAAFIVAYLTVWLGAALYLVRMGAEQRRLRRDLEALQGELTETSGPDH